MGALSWRGHRLATLFLLATAFGCHGSGGARAADAVWSESLPESVQIEIMKQRVTPALAAIFQAEEPNAFRNFGCRTCHGRKNAKARDFLPEVTQKDITRTPSGGWPTDSQFMAEKVVPAMAKAMGLAPEDPVAGNGYGCLACHRLAAN